MINIKRNSSHGAYGFCADFSYESQQSMNGPAIKLLLTDGERKFRLHTSNNLYRTLILNTFTLYSKLLGSRNTP